MTASAAAVPHADVTKLRRDTPSRRTFSSTTRRKASSARRSTSVAGSGTNSPFDPGRNGTGDSMGTSGSDLRLMCASDEGSEGATPLEDRRAVFHLGAEGLTAVQKV